MSNWLRARVSTQIKNPKRSLFDKACEEMGYKPDYTVKEVHGAYSFDESRPVDCVLRSLATGKVTTIGFHFNRNEKKEVILSVTGDFFMMPYDGETFMKRLAMHYTHVQLCETLEEQGYTIEESRIKEDEIVLVGARMAA